MTRVGSSAAPSALPRLREPHDSTAPQVSPGQQAPDSTTNAPPASSFEPSSGSPTTPAAQGPVGLAPAKVTLPALLGRVLPRRVPGAYELTPAARSQALPFAETLQHALLAPDGSRTVHAVLSALHRLTGAAVPSPERLVDEAGRLSELFVLTPAQVAGAFQGLASLGQLTRQPTSDAPAPKWQVPAGADFTRLHTLDLPLPDTEPQTVLPGVRQGWPNRSGLDEATVKGRTFGAEVLNHLSHNGSLTDGEERFFVRVGPTRCETVGELLEALTGAGYEITSRTGLRAADLFGLYAEDASGRLTPSAACLMVDTGLTDDEGKPLLMPALHGERTLSLAPPGGGPALELAWFQGLSGLGFVPHHLEAVKPWAGGKEVDELRGPSAVLAVRLADTLQQLIKEEAAAQGYPHDGYGVISTCGATEAIVQTAMTGHTNIYPTVFDKPRLGQLIERWRQDQRGDPEVLDLLAAGVRGTPSDADDERAREVPLRLLSSSPWLPGEEPFVEAAHTLATLRRRTLL